MPLQVMHLLHYINKLFNSKYRLLVMNIVIVIFVINIWLLSIYLPVKSFHKQNFIPNIYIVNDKQANIYSHPYQTNPIGTLQKGQAIIALQKVDNDSKIVKNSNMNLNIKTLNNKIDSHINKNSLYNSSNIDYNEDNDILSQWLSLIYPMNGYIQTSAILLLLNNQNYNCISKSKYLSSLNILYSCEFGSDWLHQWLIGNGRIGSLVGGVLSQEIIPISISDYYVLKRDNYDYYIKQYNKNINNFKQYFKSSRNDLVNNRFEQSETNMNKLIYNYEGKFEYISDLIFLFYESNGFIKTSNNQSNPLTNHPVNYKNNYKLTGGRDAIINQFKSNSSNSKNPILIDNNNIRHLSLLDLSNGISMSTFVIPSNNKKSSISYDVHVRRWFASHIDDIIVGKLSCDRIDITTNASKGCLNVNWQLLREGPKNPKWKDKLNTLYSYQSQPIITTNKYLLIHEKIGLGLTMTTTNLVPNSYTCLSIICNITNTNTYNNNKNSYTCDNANSLTIYINIEKQDNIEYINEIKRIYNSKNYQTNGKLGYGANYDQNSEKILGILREKCWTKLDQVLKKDYETILNDHKRSYKKMFNKFNISIDNLDTYSNISHNDLSVDNNDNKSEVSEVKDMLIMYNLGRYLFLSAATKSTSNLQGLWGEGRQSVWSGDYHTNINVQMQYWSSYTSGMSDTMTPLISFIDRMSKSGKESALNLYDCKGWVAHGFMDGYMNTGLAGEAQWSLCITCGAWLALSLWDAVTYSIDTNFIVNYFLPIYMGIAEFFIDYLFSYKLNNQTIFFSGPTTSPETSYAIYQNDIRSLSFSPAIDGSILRQVCNSYNLVIKLVEGLKFNNNNQIFNQVDINKHKQLVKELKYRVKSFSTSGLPSTSKETKRILEFPYPFPDSYTDFTAQYPNIFTNNILLATVKVDNKVNNKKAFKDNDNNNKYRFKITESFDPGHRHFSSLHWVYPGLFLPNCSGNNNYGCNNIYQSAIETLAFKRQGSGGHTSWSAAWESCLYARLGSGNEAWTALIRIASKYITSRYLSLHPPTTPIQSKREGTCKTCYTEKTTSNDDKILPNQNRGLLTQGRHVFQLDGNLGFIAGVNEMLIHSHIPGVVNILPAVSTSLSNFGGRIQGFVARGGIEISMSWTGAKKFKPTIDSSDTLTYYSGNGGKVFGLSLYLSSYHPWYGYNPNEKSVSSMIETSPGYFDWNPSITLTKRSNKQLSKITLVYPVARRYIYMIHSSNNCASQSNSIIADSSIYYPNKISNVYTDIIISTYPCRIILCMNVTMKTNDYYHTHLQDKCHQSVNYVLK